MRTKQNSKATEIQFFELYCGMSAVPWWKIFLKQTEIEAIIQFLGVIHLSTWKLIVGLTEGQIINELKIQQFITEIHYTIWKKSDIRQRHALNRL